SNVSRSPRRLPSRSASIRTMPPPPWMSVLRASSLDAVTILVCSTRRKPSSTANARVNCRARTTSSSDRMPSVSSRTTGNAGYSRSRQRAPDEAHPPLGIEGRPHSWEAQAQLDEGDGHGGAHAHHDRLGVQHARHARDVAQGAADERIDDLERGDVDQDSARAIADDRRGQLLLQGHHQAIVHLDLDGDEQELAHLEDADVLAGSRLFGHWGVDRTTLAPRRASASW